MKKSTKSLKDFNVTEEDFFKEVLKEYKKVNPSSLDFKVTGICLAIKNILEREYHFDCLTSVRAYEKLFDIKEIYDFAIWCGKQTEAETNKIGQYWFRMGEDAIKTRITILKRYIKHLRNEKDKAN